MSFKKINCNKGLEWLCKMFKNKKSASCIVFDEAINFVVQLSWMTVTYYCKKFKLCKMRIA